MVPIELFFSIGRFAHKALWKEGESVWSALLSLDAYLNGRVFVGEGTVVEPGARIVGPCILGKGCVVREGAYLRGGVIGGDGCVVGHGVEVKHSILLDGASVSHLNYVGDSILGNGANLGAGVKCANLRLDRKEIWVSYEGEKIATGLRKMGAIVGDGVQVGCNCVLNPGTLLGRESICYPLLPISGYVPPRSQVRATLSYTVEPVDPSFLLRQMR